MPSTTYVNPDTMSQPRGYTHVVKVGNTAYIAGQVSAAPVTAASWAKVTLKPRPDRYG
jgi:enamine deaminase RidA (YjgF/YER057c/UK114 family)